MFNSWLGTKILYAIRHLSLPATIKLSLCASNQRARMPQLKTVAAPRLSIDEVSIM